MGIKFTENKDVQKLFNDYTKAVMNKADDDTIKEKYGEYMKAFSNDLSEKIMQEARAERSNDADKQVLMARGQNVLTAEEERFFTNLVEDEANLDTFKEEALLPETVVEKVFEDIQAQRPLLSKINFEMTGVKARFIYGDPEGAAVWGEIFGKIQGQISDNFREVSFTQNKLTAFAIVPKDLLEFGPQWVERYVRLQFAEAIGAKLEEGIVLGGGQAENEPIGLTKEVSSADGTVKVTGDKADYGQLTLADAKTTVQELTGMYAYLSVKENGKYYNAESKMSIAVNPADKPFLIAAHTILTPNGQWVTSLPFNIDVVASEFVPQGKAIGFVAERYFAAYTGATEIKEYDQTLALEDANVYIAKQFAHGIPEDNKVSVVYDLAVEKLDDSSDEETL